MTAFEPAVSGRWRTLLWAWSVLLTLGALWGLTFSLIRIAASRGAHPLGMTFWEAFIAGLFLVLIAAHRRRPVHLSLRLPRYCLATGLLGMVVPGAAFFYAAAHLPAGVLSLTVSVVPILTYLAALLLRIETVSARRVAGVMLGTAAMALLVTPEDSLPDSSQLPWVFVGLSAAVSYAVLGLYSSLKSPTGADAMVQTTGMFVAASIMLAPIIAITNAFVPFGWPWGPVEWSLVGLGALNTASWVLFFMLLDRAGPVFTSFTANVVTIFGILWGIVIFAEVNSVWVWLSLATITVALLLVAPRENTHS